tara:strand:+ start:9113 stop:9622 length:510 start_codon:yes stop_codon:yes gene_type:complete
MVKIECNETFQAREWQSKTGDKHNIYVKTDEGEVGWLDLATAKFHNKADFNFGFVDKPNAQIIIEANKRKLYLGYLDNDKASELMESYQEKLREAVGNLGSMKFDGMDLEINIGPSKEIRKNGKSLWAKANLTVKVSNPEDIEGLYHSVSDLAAVMLDIEAERLLNRQS